MRRSHPLQTLVASFAKTLPQSFAARAWTLVYHSRIALTLLGTANEVVSIPHVVRRPDERGAHPCGA